MNPTEQVSILVVDDHPENLVAVEAVLVELKVNLVKANSGAEALRCLLRQDFAVILLDVQMPLMDGFETATLIRGRDRSSRTPIIFITAVGKESDQIQKGYSLGAVDYILKPFVPEILRWKVAVFVDLYRKTAEIKRSLADIEQLNRKLDSTNQELEAFAHSVAHDLRSPLMGMQGLASAVLEDYADKLDPTARGYIEQIVNISERMDVLIHDLLEYSRLSLPELVFKDVCLEAVVADVVDQLQAQMQKNGARVTVEGPLPDVVGQQAMLAQVVSNLLTNAIKFVAPGEKPDVRVRGERKGAWVRLEIRDNGIGIAPEFHQSIFRIFERLHGAESYPGTGIGLAIVRKGVERMGGQVGVDSTPAKGSTFWVELRGA